MQTAQVLVYHLSENGLETSEPTDKNYGNTLASFLYWVLFVLRMTGATVHANKEQGRDEGDSIFILHGYVDMTPAEAHTLLLGKKMMYRASSPHKQFMADIAMRAKLLSSKGSALQSVMPPH